MNTDLPSTDLPSTDLTTIIVDDIVPLLNSKPFRCSKYDQFDILYSSHMKRIFENVENDIKDAFTIFTGNLIYEEDAISRFKLLDSIDEFKCTLIYNSILKKDKEDNKDNKDNKYWEDRFIQWNKFTDEAFNYRPHQPCIIS